MHDGKYGSGRFCSQSCGAKFSKLSSRPHDSSAKDSAYRSKSAANCTVTHTAGYGLGALVEVLYEETDPDGRPVEKWCVRHTYPHGLDRPWSAIRQLVR
jgi:hypothetical protein